MNKDHISQIAKVKDGIIKHHAHVTMQSLSQQGYRPLSHGGHFESQKNKKLCFCPSSLALDERLDAQNLFFQHCVIKVYCSVAQRKKFYF